jgi:predicted glycosyltransferase
MQQSSRDDYSIAPTRILRHMITPRLALYCHNTYGLGHVTRSLLIANAAIAMGAECAVITGCRHLSKLHCPAGIRVHTLSPARLDALGRPVSFNGGERDIVARRADQILQFSRAWRPHALLVDQHPLGLGGELKSTLLDDNLIDMRLIWGLPYSQGAPTKQYRDPCLVRALSRYDCLLAYSDKQFDDILLPFDPQMLPPRVEYTGFITSHPQPAQRKQRDQIVLLCGGGFGATEFYEVILESLGSFRTHPVRIVAGPASDDLMLTTLARRYGAEILRCPTLDQAVQDAALVISRAGYNTSLYLIQTDLPVIFVPQDLGDDDQPGRAHKLSHLSHIWSINYTRDGFVTQLTSIVTRALKTEREPRDIRMQLNGTSRAATLLMDIITQR